MFSFLSLLVTATLGLAQSPLPHYMMLQPAFHRDRPGPQNLCREIFQIPSYDLIKVEESWDSQYQRGAQVIGRHKATERASAVTDLVELTLRDWKASGHYSNAKIDYLRRKEAALSPERTSYHFFSAEGKNLPIRIYDGSVRPLLMGIQWSGIHARDPRTPIEKIYNYRFPERDLMEHSQIWELGLLSAPQFFSGGVEAIFHRLALILDKHYNTHLMGTFGESSNLAEGRFGIYGVSREALVPRYEELGFTRVTDAKTMKPVVFDDGMVLIRMSGETLLKNFINQQAMPSTANSRYVRTSEGERTDLLRLQRNQWLRKRYIPNMTLKRAIDEYLWLYRYLQEISAMPKGSLATEKEWRHFVESSYILWQSVPEGFLPYGRWYETLSEIQALLSITAKNVDMENVFHVLHLPEYLGPRR